MNRMDLVLGRTWLAIALASTCVVGASYSLAQQTLRTTADDPQIQIAEDAARQLRDGAHLAEPRAPVELDSSLAPWLMVYDRSGRQISSSAELDGRPVSYVLDVLHNVRPGTEKRITWAPRPSVRQATVVVGFDGGWVVAGRSLRMTEERTRTLLPISALAWLAALIGSAGLLSLMPALGRHRSVMPRSST